LFGIIVILGASACGETERSPAGFLTPKPLGAGGAAGTAGAFGASGAAPLAGAAPVAGTGGAIAKPEFNVSAAVDECIQYCEKLPYRLPLALCEDWNHPPWNPQFCHHDFAGPCPDYCNQLYGVVSLPCAETLPPVIRCVAPTYEKTSVDLSADCWLKDCRDQLFTMTSACYGLREQLDAARATWEASGIVDYDLQYDLGAGTPVHVQVRAGADPAVTPADATPWTVAQLFDGVERYLAAPSMAPTATYDPDLGYPTYLGHYQGCSSAIGDVGGVTVAPLR
jgi:hypothetical protein